MRGMRGEKEKMQCPNLPYARTLPSVRTPGSAMAEKRERGMVGKKEERIVGKRAGKRVGYY